MPQSSSLVPLRILILYPNQCSLVEAVRGLRQELQQAGAAVASLPMLMAAVYAAARCTAPILQLTDALEPVPPGEEGSGGDSNARFRPAEGADGDYDAARQQLAAAQQAYDEVVQAEQQAYGGGGAGVGVADAARGVLCVPAQLVGGRPLPQGHQLLGPLPAVGIAGGGRMAAAAQRAVAVAVPQLQAAWQRLEEARVCEVAACSRVLAAAGQHFMQAYGSFTALVSAAASLDVLAAFATATGAAAPTGCSFCRPVFAAAAPEASNAGAAAAGGAGAPLLQLQGLWHPLLCGSTGGGAGDSVAPNDLQLGGSCTGSLLLTGGWVGVPAELVLAG